MIELRFRIAALAIGGVLAAAGAVMSSDTILTLRRGAETFPFSQRDLESLPWTTVVTGHRFADGQVAYRGPLARDVIAMLALADFETVDVHAANDFCARIPTEEFEDYDVILAMEADGVRLSERDMGPLWLMYPISDHQALGDETYGNRLVWQVVEIAAP